jgi:hypothetical protein
MSVRPIGSCVLVDKIISSNEVAAPLWSEENVQELWGGNSALIVSAFLFADRSVLCDFGTIAPRHLTTLWASTACCRDNLTCYHLIYTQSIDRLLLRLPLMRHLTQSVSTVVLSCS